MKRTLLVVNTLIGGRRRVAPRVETTSDETRFRGFRGALLAGALTTVACLAVVLGPSGLRSPGPLARPHQVAQLGCESCHGTEPATRSCGGCHGTERALRPGHQELRAAGEIGCSSCHAIHRTEEGVTFAASGGAVHWGSGWEQSVAAPARFRGLDVSVPLVRASACASCHDANVASDPAAPCLPDAAGYNVCFDEHRRVASVTRGSASRDAAWQAAREVAAHVQPPARRPLPAFGAIGAGLGAAGLALVLQRRLRRRRETEASAITRPSALRLRAPERRRLPVIDASRCLGCYACVDACPYDVLEVERFVARVARPDDCCGLTLCEQRCPNGSLVVREIGEPSSAPAGPRLTSELQAKDCPGVFFAGDVTGTALIRHAIEQGAVAARGVAASLASQAARRPSSQMHDVVVIGAGPAGLSAALEAQAAGLDVLVLEQGSIAESIRSFPRDKIVFDAVPENARASSLWLAEAGKEELLAHWDRAVRRAKLRVEESLRVARVHGRGQGFEVEALPAEDAETQPRRWLARRIVLAVGRRGSPRRLAATISPRMQSRVHYHLADARSFAGRRVLVVGLGDQALEAIAALAAQPQTSVVVSYRGDGFRRGKQRNLEAVQRLIAANRVRIVWQSEVTQIDDGAARLRVSGQEERVRCDAVLALIGSLPARGLLEGLGLETLKKGHPQR